MTPRYLTILFTSDPSCGSPMRPRVPVNPSGPFYADPPVKATPSGETSAGPAQHSDLESHSLGQGEILPPVDRVGLAPHVDLPGIGAGLASSSGLLFSPERTADLGPGGAD